jgi:hypothetical protein
MGFMKPASGRQRSTILPLIFYFRWVPRDGPCGVGRGDIGEAVFPGRALRVGCSKGPPIGKHEGRPESGSSPSGPDSIFREDLGDSFKTGANAGPQVCVLVGYEDCQGYGRDSRAAPLIFGVSPHP